MTAAELLLPRVVRRWPDAEIVDPSVVRFTRQFDGKKYAVIYLDVGGELPSNSKELCDYQERVIGSRYFSGEKSLQWNTYLYFFRDEILAGKSADTHLRDLIESDRLYARKRIVRRAELSSILEPEVVKQSGAMPSVGLLSKWSEILEQAGIQGAVFGEKKLPERIKLIERAQASPSKTSYRNTPKTPRPQMLRAIELSKYRAYPSQRSFDFGRVNLFFGANGAGKTSLLEAIELFFCGKSGRNPKANESYSFHATLWNGEAEHAASSRPLQLFRDRNLAWYGQPEVNTANIFQSFGQFNFLDTDAAVGLAASASDLEADLSKLLVGPDVSRLWDNVERVHAEVLRELRVLKDARRRINEEMANIRGAMDVGAGEHQLSDELLLGIKKSLSVARWVDADITDRASALKLLAALDELAGVIERFGKIRWSAPSPSKSEAAADLERARASQNVAQKLLGEIDRVQKEVLELKRGQEDARRRIGVLEELALHRKSKIRELTATRSNLRGRLEQLLRQPRASLAIRDWLPEHISRGSVHTAVDHYAGDVSANGLLLDNARRLVGELEGTLSHAESMRQRLQDAACAVLEAQHDKDECPLCHTRFEDGQLAVRMQAELSDRLSESLACALESQRSLDEARNVLLDRRDALVALRDWANLTQAAADASVEALLTEIAMSSAEADKVEAELARVEQAIDLLSAQGVSEPRHHEIEGWLERWLGGGGTRIGTVGSDDIVALIAGERSELESVTSAIGTLTSDGDALASELAGVLEVAGGEVEELRLVQKTQADWLHSAESLLREFELVSPAFVFLGETSLLNLRSEVQKLRDQASSLERAFATEAQASELKVRMVERKAVLEAQLASITQRGKAFQNATQALTDIVENHSLEAAVDESLGRNRRAIETIFTQIHSPAEFAGIGSQLRHLRRIDGEREATLSEISTGQRAAYALSIFLAQNAQLKDGPPVMLIDDPVAHVDDMNFLSLLDYLREVAVQGSRQIFFSTANEKIASLFQRKFDFLGEGEFQRIDLERQ